MELALEGSRPSQSWRYREEDFGGFWQGWPVGGVVMTLPWPLPETL